METIETLRSDVAALYERLTGEDFPHERFRKQPVPLPPHVEPKDYLRRELVTLARLVDERVPREPVKAAPTWVPAADTFEAESGFTVRLELPGLQKSDIEVSLAENVLRIRGERRLTPPGAARLLSSERAFGRFERAFVLPYAVERESIFVRLADGLLEIHVARKPRPRAGVESIPVT